MFKNLIALNIKILMISWLLLLLAQYAGSTNTWRITSFDSYRNGNDEVYSLDLNSGLTVNLSNNPNRDFNLSLSPDSHWFAFASEDDKNNIIYLGNALTGEISRVYQTDETQSHFNFKWSSNSRYLAFFDGQTHVVDTITEVVEDFKGYYPTWSPDSKWLAILSIRQAGEGILSLINLETGERIALNKDDVMAPYFWSPDSQQIAFVSNSGSIRRGNELYLLEVERERVTLIAQNVRIDYLANNIWSPNGKHLAFNGYIDGNQLEILLANPNSLDSVPFNISNNIDPDTNPIWSPNGQWIAFNSSGNKSLIYAYEINTGNLVKLPEFNYSIINVLAWHPNSTHLLLFMWSAISGHAEIQIFDITTGIATPLGSFAFFKMHYPQISSDGNLVSFKYWQKNAEEIHIIDLDTMTLTNSNMQINVPEPTPIMMRLE